MIQLRAASEPLDEWIIDAFASSDAQPMPDGIAILLVEICATRHTVNNGIEDALTERTDGALARRKGLAHGIALLHEALCARNRGVGDLLHAGAHSDKMAVRGRAARGARWDFAMWVPINPERVERDTDRAEVCTDGEWIIIKTIDFTLLVRRDQPATERRLALPGVRQWRQRRGTMLFV